MHAAGLTMGLLFLAAGTALTATPALGEEQVVDLGGGPFFGFDVQPDKGDYFPPEPFFDFHYVIPSDETVRLTHGSMHDGSGRWWYDYVEYRIVIDGELVFGDGFPSDGVCVQCYGFVPVQVNGIFRIDNSITKFDGNHTTGIRIADEGALIIEPMQSVRMAGIYSDGTVFFACGLKYESGFTQ